MVRTFAIYAVAAMAEIAGCFATWVWLRRAGSPLWLLPGAMCLVAFALLLTRADAAFAGRAFAAYGGIYIAASLIWLAIVEGASVSRWDLAGAALCVIGAAIIIVGPRFG